MKRNLLSLAVGLGLAMAATAQAQTAPPAADATDAKDKPATLQEIQVTARRREETLQDVPVAVTAFTPEAIEKLNIRDLGDLDAQVPNLTIYAARGSNSTVTAYIRGVGQSDPLWGVDPGVGIYLDDVYIARPQGALLDVFDVGRIEVLRGPQGTLYGKNTIGGAIKYVSRPLPTELEGYAQVTAGNYGQLDAKAAIGGPFAGSQALRGRIAVASLHRDGFGENVVTDAPVTNKEILAARATLGAWLSDDFDVQFNIDWMDDQSGVRGAQMLAPNFAAPGVLPLDDRYDVRNGMPNINDTSMFGASFIANYRVNDSWRLKYVLARRESDTETNIDFDTLPNKIADVKAFYSDEQLSHEWQASYDGGGRARGVMGLYWFRGQAGGQVLNNFFNLLFGDTHGQIETDSVAGYADWSFDVAPKWEVEVGARYTIEDKHATVLNRFYSDATYTTLRAFAPIAADFDKTVGFTNVSPKIAINYQVTDDIMVYGLATRGFKSGGFNIRANTASAPRSGLPFDDEQVNSFEIGAKAAFLDKRLFVNAAAFHNEYNDVQLSVFTGIDTNGDGVDDAFFGDFTNAGAATVDGLEIEYQWLASQNWLVSGNVAWLDARFDEFMFKGFNIADQQEVTNAPDFSGAINVEYHTPLARGGEISARVGYSWQDDVVATTEITHDPVLNSNVAPITQEGYGLLNAGVVWKTGGAWTVALQGTNLTDKDYLTTGYVIPTLGVRTGFHGAPRQVSLSVKYEF